MPEQPGSMRRLALSFAAFLAFLALPVGKVVAADEPTFDVAQAMAPRYLGDVQAPLTITEFSSFTCPHCRSFHENAFKDIKRDYIETGKVRFTIVDFPLDGRALGASMLTRCVDRSRYFTFVDLVFQQQQQWANQQDPGQALGQLAGWAGLSQAEAEACLTNQPLLDAILAEREQAALDYTISATPSFLIGDKLVRGNSDFADLRDIIEDELVAR